MYIIELQSGGKPVKYFSGMDNCCADWVTESAHAKRFKKRENTKEMVALLTPFTRGKLIIRQVEG